MDRLIHWEEDIPRGKSRVVSASRNLVACSDETDVKAFWSLPQVSNKMFLLVARRNRNRGDVWAWVRTQDEFYRREVLRRAKMEFPESEVLINPIGAERLKTSNWRFALDFAAETKHGLFSVQALRRDASRGEGMPAAIVPVHFVFWNRLTRYDEMLLTFDGMMLSEALGREVPHGELVNGNQYKMRHVQTSARARNVRALTQKMIASLKMDSPPDLVLNRHCAECEFRVRCRERAIQSDDLSLLSERNARAIQGCADLRFLRGLRCSTMHAAKVHCSFPQGY
jgi:hypothetical protein